MQSFSLIEHLKHNIMGAIGPWQIVLIILLALLLFGGKKLPELMKGLGKGIKEFKSATGGEQDTDSKNNSTDKKDNA